MKITKLLRLGVILLSFSLFQSFISVNGTNNDDDKRPEIPNNRWIMTNGEFHEALKMEIILLKIKFDSFEFNIPECDEWTFMVVYEACGGEGPSSYINQCDLYEIIDNGGHPMIRSWRQLGDTDNQYMYHNDENQCM